MKIFVISRRQDGARREALVAQLRARRLAFELVEAVDGRALGCAEKRRLADFPKMRRVLRVLSDGEIGCAASHQAVYRRMRAEGLPAACVLEDDARLVGDFAREVGGEGPGGAGGEGECRVRLLTDRRRGMVWTVGYVITRAGAEAMLRYNTPIWRVADCWESLVRRGRLALDWSVSACVEPDGRLPSVITPEGRPPHRQPLAMDAWSRAKRAFWRLWYGIGLKV